MQIALLQGRKAACSSIPCETHTVFRQGWTAVLSISDGPADPTRVRVWQIAIPTFGSAGPASTRMLFRKDTLLRYTGVLLMLRRCRLRQVHCSEFRNLGRIK